MMIGQTIRAFVGQQDKLDSVVGALSESEQLGVLITGESGLGKSALAQAALQQVATSLRPFRISPSQALSAVPYGALERFTSLQDGNVPINEGEVVANIQRSLTARLGSSAMRAVVVIDDAHHLDGQSARVLAQLAVLGVAKLVVVSRSTPEPPQEFLSLWGDGLLARFEMSPLTEYQAQEISQRALGGKLSANASRTLCLAVGGNPQLLHALLHQLYNEGQLVERHGTWALHKYSPNAGVELTDLVRERLADLLPAELEVLETVALAYPIELTRLLEMAPLEVIDALEESRAIHISEGRGRHVSPGYPLLGVVVRQLVPSARSRAIYGKVLQTMHGLHPAGQQLVRMVSWALDCGLEVTEQDLLDAAAYANQHGDSSLALRAAGAVRGEDKQLQARVEIGLAHLHSGDTSAAADVLEGCLDVPGPPDVRQAGVNLLGLLALRHDDAQGALAELANRWERVRGADQEGAATADGPALLRLQILMMQGKFVDAEPDLRQLVADGEKSIQPKARMMLTELLACTGHLHEALEVAETCLRPVGTHAVSRFHDLEHLEFLRCVALIGLGRLNAVADTAERRVTPATEEGSPSSGSLVAQALAAVAQGKMLYAANLLAEAIDDLEIWDPGLILGYALGLGTYVASMTGNRQLHDDYNRRLDHLAYPGSKHFELLAHAYSAASMASVYGASYSINSLRHLALNNAQVGAVTAELEIRSLALQLGDTDQLNRLWELSSAYEGEPAAYLNRYAVGVQNQDPASLIGASEQFAAVGFMLLSAECLGQAVLLLQTHGDRKRARDAMQLLHLRRLGLEGVVTLQLGGSEDVTELTPRERDIVTMVVNGQSNRQIAEHASLSVRTVEGHLYRIFAKLGINRREDLSVTDLMLGRPNLSIRR